MSGNVWMFSDQIDDEDLAFMAHECGAVYKIGKKVLIRRSIFESYLRKQRKI